MKFLILGGTKFLGRHLVDVALSRGHEITLFNRGQTNPLLFPEVEKLRGDRAGNLEALKGRRWDAVIDTCGFASAKVRAGAELLADAVEHYTFISSISVYRDFSRSGLDETALVSLLPEGATEDEMDGSGYGARKVLCEQSVGRALPGRVLNIRSGVIVGPHDSTGRFAYWVCRADRGGEILSPAPPEAPIQLIDAQDLAGWIIRMAETKKVGTYNAASPAFALTFRQMLEECQTASGSDGHLTWVDEEFLLNHGIVPFSNLPLWIPQRAKESAGFFTVDCSLAFESGLVCRPLVETARDTLIWKHDSITDSSSQNQIGLSPERETQLLQAWKIIPHLNSTS